MLLQENASINPLELYVSAAIYGGPWDERTNDRFETSDRVEEEGVPDTRQGVSWSCSATIVATRRRRSISPEDGTLYPLVSMKTTTNTRIWYITAYCSILS